MIYFIHHKMNVLKKAFPEFASITRDGNTINCTTKNGTVNIANDFGLYNSQYLANDKWYIGIPEISKSIVDVTQKALNDGKKHINNVHKWHVDNINKAKSTHKQKELV